MEQYYKLLQGVMSNIIQLQSNIDQKSDLKTDWLCLHDNIEILEREIWRLKELVKWHQRKDSEHGKDQPLD
jgi:hypothetical protein